MNCGILTKLSAGFFCPFCDIKGTVTVHLNNRVSNVEIRSGASRYHNGRDSALFIEPFCSFNKGGNGFFIPADYLLHQFVPDHKVSGGSILIDEKYLAA